MLIHMIVFILVKVTITNGNAGTALFYNKHYKTDCWSEDDILKLYARKTFEEIIPPAVKPDEIDAKYIKEVLRYFRKALYSMDNIASPHKLPLLKEALSDTIGAHLRSDILPAVRFAYYAGYVPYRSARQLHDFFDDVKGYLNTQGIGWKKPRKASQNWSNLTVAKVLIGAGTFFDPCSCLIIKRDSNDCIHLPIPKQDNDCEPSAIALPFKTGGLVNLISPDSKNILLKYYTIASRCILSSSPEKCRHSDFVSFNNDLWHWMKRDVAPHLIDEKLYAAYGGILRIAASVQNYGKGLSRRNLYDYEETSGLGKWHPWRTFTQSYLYINADWTPKLYVGLVILTAFTIYLLQMCYSYMFGESNGCHCKGKSKSFFTSEAAYANVDKKFMTFPRQSAIYYSDKKRAKQPISKSKSASLGTIQTQKVYDLNENTEKLMAVIMSDNEESLVESSPTQCSEEEGEENVIDVGQIKPTQSPPKIETSISQLTIDRKTRGQPRLPLYSTSTMTHTQTERHVSDSLWSATETSTSSRSGSTTTSKSRRSRSSRDLAWARRVISKHTLRSTTKSTPRSEVDINNSYTSPTSHR